MASATERTDRDGQQVMSAQGQSPTQASRVAEDGARLEGETAGPDYARTAATVHGVEPALQLPNGTGPQASPRTADHSPGIQSLPYSPVALRQSRGPQATYGGFFQEAWPTQPQEGMEPNKISGGGPVFWKPAGSARLDAAIGRVFQSSDGGKLERQRPGPLSRGRG